MTEKLIEQRNRIRDLEFEIEVLKEVHKLDLPYEAREILIKQHMQHYNLHNEISPTMVWSYKYQTLITPNKMEEIKEEEQEYIKRQKEREQ